MRIHHSYIANAQYSIMQNMERKESRVLILLNVLMSSSFMGKNIAVAISVYMCVLSFQLTLV